MKNENAFFDKFHIGTYFLQANARSEQHIKELAECNIDLVFGMDTDIAVLDLLHKYEINAVVSGILPGWFGGNGQNAGTMSKSNPEEAYRTCARLFVDHPAIVGIDIGDEPSSLDFPYYGKIVSLLTDYFPNKFLYLNLYPSYGLSAGTSKLQVEAELGKITYREYLKAYCDNVDLPYISLDHYVYSSNVEQFLADLSDAASCCKEYNRKLMVVLQVNSNKKEEFLSLEQLRFQAFCALAYGASVISWACYCAGWWYNQVLDDSGNKTEQYEKLKRVNCEVRNFSTEYVHYSWIETHSLDNHTSLSFDNFEEVTSSEQAVLGIFENGEGEKGILYTLLDYEGKDGTLCFQYHGSKPLYCRSMEGRKELFPLSNNTYRISYETPQPFFLFCE